MAVWQENLNRLLRQKEVLILHGNVRDTGYIGQDGAVIPGLAELIRNTARNLGYQRAIFWGVFFDSDDKGHSPMWSLERIEYLQAEAKPGAQAETRTSESETRDVIVLTRWLEQDIRDTEKKTIFVINYIDKITPYSQRGMYPKDTALLITLIQKIIENIRENNRLIMIALRDTMLPLEYYTNSPRVAVMEVPMPDLEERKAYFSQHLSRLELSRDQNDLLSNITDGLYMRDLENILRDVLKDKPSSPAMLRKTVNRYRIGTDEDPWAQLPIVSSPDSADKKGLIDSAEQWFKKRVSGQDHAIGECVKALKKARAGVTGIASDVESKPKAVFFFAGPTGVGKTLLARKLAEYLFDKEAFQRFDMSEFKEEHTVSKMIGSPPGYVGYEEGGRLTNALKNRPFSVILFDEIEKAHPKIMDIFLQILDAGRLTDSRGQTIFFTESVIIFTSNIGTRTTPIDEISELTNILKEHDEDKKRAMVRAHFEEAVRNYFASEISRPELLNRIGSNIIAFNYFDRKDAQKELIVNKLGDIASNFQDKFENLGHKLLFAEGVAKFFLEKHEKSIEKFGGRGLVNAIEDEVGFLIAEQLLYAEKDKLRNRTLEIFVSDKGELRCRKRNAT